MRQGYDKTQANLSKIGQLNSAGNNINFLKEANDKLEKELSREVTEKSKATRQISEQEVRIKQLEQKIREREKNYDEKKNKVSELESRV